jgi:23S rRNA G2069 N7-methylase RlmK/C1962 C5-methylase RlmI
MSTNNYRISEVEKQFAIAHLTRTGEEFINSIRDINEKQWYMRPGPGQWSAAECADHLLQTELYYFMPTIQQMLAEPANPDRRSETQGKDEISYQSMENRSYKIKGQPWDESSETVVDKAALMEAFTAKRKEIIEWLRQSDDEFRVHYTTFPGLETIDVYQFILMISGHTTRHTGQINDIKELEFFQQAVPA